MMILIFDSFTCELEWTLDTTLFVKVHVYTVVSIENVKIKETKLFLFLVNLNKACLCECVDIHFDGQWFENYVKSKNKKS